MKHSLSWRWYQQIFYLFLEVFCVFAMFIMFVLQYLQRQAQVNLVNMSLNESLLLFKKGLMWMQGV